MTTKKQKREQVAARRADYEADLRQTGLRAQARDREYRERKAARAEENKQAKDG